MNGEYPAKTGRFESSTNKLRVAYRHTLSATVVAKARYLSLEDEPSVPRRVAQRALMDWLVLEARKQSIARRLSGAEGEVASGTMPATPRG